MAFASRISVAAKSAPVVSLGIVFVFWKVLLLFLVVLCPGPGYDTSTTLLVSQANTNVSSGLLLDSSNRLTPYYLKLARWDAIYFASIADRGYLYEQDWAFGVGHTKTLAGISSLVPGTNDITTPISVGVVLSHFWHLCSILVLYAFTGLLFREQGRDSPNIAFLAAALHIVSPAGLFLSAPYAEPLFSLLNFLGHYLYLRASLSYQKRHAGISAILVVFSGLSFAVATTNRSNGILSGWLFFYDVLMLIPNFIAQNNRRVTARILSLVLGGLCIAVAMVLPQVFAYGVYCTEEIDRRPWCSNTIPSISAWVQSFYWNVGFFCYWTVSNIPLFLLATPTLYLLLSSSFDALRGEIGNGSKQTRKLNKFQHVALQQLAVPQLLLSVLAISTYHVQIITRISSGSPLWYLWIAWKIRDGAGDARGAKSARTVVTWMVMYAMIQGGLFAAFLPPA